LAGGVSFSFAANQIIVAPLLDVGNSAPRLTRNHRQDAKPSSTGQHVGSLVRTRLSSPIVYGCIYYLEKQISLKICTIIREF
jgi:hypothetical protein